MSPAELKAALCAKARELGFDDCRVAVAAPAAHRALYEKWIAEGKHGDMAWMARNVERRTDPRLVLEGAQRVVVLAMNYFQGAGPATDYRIARYAWNDDYHDMVEKRLKELEAFLTEHGGTQPADAMGSVSFGMTRLHSFGGHAGRWIGRTRKGRRECHQPQATACSAASCGCMLLPLAGADHAKLPTVGAASGNAWAMMRCGVMRPPGAIEVSNQRLVR